MRQIHTWETNEKDAFKALFKDISYYKRNDFCYKRFRLEPSYRRRRSTMKEPEDIFRHLKEVFPEYTVRLLIDELKACKVKEHRLDIFADQISDISSPFNNK